MHGIRPDALRGDAVTEGRGDIGEGDPDPEAVVAFVDVRNNDVAAAALLKKPSLRGLPIHPWGAAYSTAATVAPARSRTISWEVSW